MDKSNQHIKLVLNCVLSTFILVIYSCNSNKNQLMHDPCCDPYGYPKHTADQQTVIELFKNKMFKNLDSLLCSYQKRAETDVRQEYLLWDALKTIKAVSATSDSLFSEWVASDSTSEMPRLARGYHYGDFAGRSRGTNWAKDTPRENFSRMDDYCALAKADLTTAVKMNPRLMVAYLELSTMAKAQGNHDEIEECLRKGLEISPYSFLLRVTYLQDIIPRWGGSYARMAKVAQEAQKYKRQNPRLVLLLGVVDWEKGRMFDLQENYKKAISCYNKALAFGEYFLFYRERANSLCKIKEYDKALEDINRAMDLHPGSGSDLCLRAQIYSEFGKQKNNPLNIQLWELGLSDIRNAYQLSPDDPTIKWWYLSYEKWALSQPR